MANVGILLLIISICLLIYGILNYNNINFNTQLTLSIIGGSTLLLITSILILTSSKNSIYKDYLTKVYPAMDQNRSPKDYENLYHSLGWYYQCCNKSDTTIKYKDKKWQLNGQKAIGSTGEQAQLLRYVPSMEHGNQKAKFSMKDFNNKKIPIWDVMTCCVDKYKLPVIPRGNLYDWWSFQYFSVPTVTVNKNGQWKFADTDIYSNNRNIDTFASQSAYTTFQGYQVFDTNGNSFYPSPENPLVDPNNIIPTGLWSGPGPFYGGGRAIMKSIYYPHCPHFSYTEQKWSLYNTFDTNKWLTEYLTPSKLPMKDSNMNKKWIHGFDEGDYMELTHVEQTPGMVQSTGYWLNYFGSGGTGIFYKVGKTPKVSEDAVKEMEKYIPEASVLKGCSPRNKAHALFTLLWEIKNTKKLPQQAGSYFFKSQNKVYNDGSKLLKAFYGTDDPWYITMWHCNGWAPKNNDRGWSDYNYDNWNNGNTLPDCIPIDDWAVDKNGNTFVNPLSWASPPWMKKDPKEPSYNIGPNTKFITRQVGPAFTASIKNIGKETVNQNNKINLNSFYGVMDQNNGVLYATLCAFLLSIEFDSNDTNYKKYIKTPAKYDNQNVYNTQPNLYSNTDRPVGTLTMEGVKYSLVKQFMNNWFFDRVSNGVTFDEPINYFASILGYDFIQMPCNTNTSGMWCYECIYLGLPKRTDNLGLELTNEAFNWYTDLVTKRQYGLIENNPNYGPSYLGPYVAIMNQLMAKNLSQRDPFDLSKSLPCYNLGGIDCKNTPGTTCHKKTPLTQSGGAFSNYYNATCSVEPNVGMTIQNLNTEGTVLWDPNNFCHVPWGLKDFGNNGQMWGQQLANGHIFCQSDTDEPSLSSIWSNVIYGGKGYGTGLVPLKSELLEKTQSN
jgi:hypothetical protein